MRAPLFLLLLASAYAFSQPISVGMKLGIPATDLVKRTQGFRNGRYVIGPTVELRLPYRVSIELDVLYRSLGFRSQFGGTATDSGSAWEFPLLGKYRFSGGLVSPFVDAGLVLSHISGLRALTSFSVPGNKGFVFGVGLEGKLLFLKLTPEIRYTRWTAEQAQVNAPASVNLANRNQVEALVGITF